MSKLNDDIWLYIFGLLNVHDQLALANTCERFMYLMTEVTWKRFYRNFYTDSVETAEFTIDEYITLFTLNVGNIERLTIGDTHRYAFTSYLGRYKQRPELSFYFSFTYPKLRAFKCRNSFHDGFMRLVADKCPKLEELYVSSVHVTGAHIKDMHNLRVLEVPNSSLTESNLREILSNLDLTHLNVAHSLVATAVFDIDSAAKLQCLTISANDIIQIVSYGIPNLNHLKTLNLTEVNGPNLDRLNDFLNAVGPRIKEINLGYLKLTLAVQITSKMSSLQKIHYYGSFPDSHLEAFFEHPTVQEIHCYCLPAYHLPTCCSKVIVEDTLNNDFTHWKDAVQSVLANLQKLKGRKKMFLYAIDNGNLCKHCFFMDPQGFLKMFEIQQNLRFFKYQILRKAPEEWDQNVTLMEFVF